MGLLLALTFVWNVGKVELVAEPTDEQVDALHEIYCAKLTALYYAHRDAHGYAGVELKVI